MINLGIDLDPIVYSSGFIVEHNFYDVSKKGIHIGTWEGKRSLNTWLKENDKKESDFDIEKRIEVEPIQNAYHILDTRISSIIEAVGAEQVFLYLTSNKKGVNFRDYIAVTQPYKERPSTKPVYYHQLREYLVKKWKAEVIEGYEADDALAIMAYACAADESEYVLATIDKDLQMVPGWHYNYDTKKFKYQDYNSAMRCFYMQLLMGDKTDTIPGIPGIGPKKAEGILEGKVTVYEMYQATLKAYQSKYKEIAERVLIEQARLLWMLRWPKDVWLPPEKNDD